MGDVGAQLPVSRLRSWSVNADGCGLTSRAGSNGGHCRAGVTRGVAAQAASASNEAINASLKGRKLEEVIGAVLYELRGDGAKRGSLPGIGSSGGAGKLGGGEFVGLLLVADAAHVAGAERGHEQRGDRQQPVRHGDEAEHG